MTAVSSSFVISLCTWSLALCSPVVLPASNIVVKRSDPDVFREAWTPYVLLNGEEPSVNFSDKVFGLPALEIERSFDGPRATASCRSFWYASYLASSVYLIFIHIGPTWMKDRKAWNLKTSLAAWNLFLAVFSFVGALRTVPQLLGSLHEFGFQYSICRAAAPYYGNGAVGMWVYAFILSKYFELVDTLFLILRRKDVGFLHWYHHFSVLLYCWHAYMWEMPTGLYFVSMNYTVHAIMYFYYFLAGVMAKPPRWGLLVTTMQLLQMVVGMVVTGTHISAMLNGTVPNCDGHLPNLQAAFVMYGSYFLLFAQFFVKRYCKRRDNSKEKQT